MADAVSETSSVKIERFLRQTPDGSIRSVLPSLPPQDERPLKDSSEKLLMHLLKSGDPEFVNEFLFSKRNREEVNGILSLVGGPEYDESSSTDVILIDLRKLARGQKILKECNKDWHPSICYPLPHDSVCDMHLPNHLYALYSELDWPVLSGRGIRFHGDVASSDVIPDVVSSLSLGGGAEPTLVDQTAKEIVVLKPGTFKGKYVLVFCINAPVIIGSDGCQSLLNLCNELYSYSKSGNLEMVMVMVARMNILADTEGVFEHLFSGFPPSSLAVPYDDWERRERIWKLLKGGSYGIRCSVYNTDGNFLTSFCVDGPESPCGAEAFPFTEKMFKKTDDERKRLRKEGSLEELLRPYESSSDVVVQELNSGQKKGISEVIKNKHAGLYVCCECDSPLAPLVQKLYEQCKIKEQEFEIVVLSLPLLSEIDPELIQEKIESLWRKQNICGWWCLPFNNSVSLRFWGLTKDCDCDYTYDEWKEDKLIIVGPDGKILDMYGAQVIQRHDGFDAYPFTRAAVVQKEKMQVNDLGLDSLLVGKLVRGNNPSDAITAEDLFSSQKRIIIILGNPHDRNVKGLVSRYKEADRSEFEVVFIVFPRGEVGEEEEEEEEEEEDWGEMPPWMVEMPWYIHRPLDGIIAKKLNEFVPFDSLVGFGKDGLICSVKHLDELDEGWTWGLCLEDTLYDAIYRRFRFDQYAEI